MAGSFLFTRRGLPLTLAALAPLDTAFAHHSLVAEYDVNTSVELLGRVSRLDWINPHIALFVEVIDAEGMIQTWECELGSPNPLIQAGWRKEDLPVGSVVRLKANPARDGSPACSSRNLQFEDGTPVFTLWGVR